MKKRCFYKKKMKDCSGKKSKQPLIKNSKEMREQQVKFIRIATEFAKLFNGTFKCNF